MKTGRPPARPVTPWSGATFRRHGATSSGFRRQFSRPRERCLKGRHWRSHLVKAPTRAVHSTILEKVGLCFLGKDELHCSLVSAFC
jgi:hypothetical protein